MINLQPMLPEHAEAVLDIYRHGIASGMATFETEAPEWNVFNSKYLPHSRIIAVESIQSSSGTSEASGDWIGDIIGWSALNPVSPRACYNGVAEVSVYVHQHHQRKGIGRALLQALILESEQNGTWSLLSVIHEENRASIHLHEQCGFRFIGYRERIAQLDGIWRTTVMMEKRSRKVGV